MAGNAMRMSIRLVVLVAAVTMAGSCGGGSTDDSEVGGVGEAKAGEVSLDDPCTWATAEDFAQIDAIDPDVVILGTGARQRFIHPRLIAALTARRVGVETMDNPAACRTYNILMAEGRRVALALILDTPAE